MSPGEQNRLLTGQIHPKQVISIYAISHAPRRPAEVPRATATLLMLFLCVSGHPPSITLLWPAEHRRGATGRVGCQESKSSVLGGFRWSEPILLPGLTFCTVTYRPAHTPQTIAKGHLSRRMARVSQHPSLMSITIVRIPEFHL